MGFSDFEEISKNTYVYIPNVKFYLNGLVMSPPPAVTKTHRSSKDQKDIVRKYVKKTISDFAALEKRLLEVKKYGGLVGDSISHLRSAKSAWLLQTVGDLERRYEIRAGSTLAQIVMPDEHWLHLVAIFSTYFVGEKNLTQFMEKDEWLEEGYYNYGVEIRDGVAKLGKLEKSRDFFFKWLETNLPEYHSKMKSPVEGKLSLKTAKQRFTDSYKRYAQIIEDLKNGSRPGVKSSEELLR